MKNLVEILGSTQLLLGINFDPDVLFEERLSVEHRAFPVLLRIIEEHLSPREEAPADETEPPEEKEPLDDFNKKFIRNERQRPESYPLPAEPLSGVAFSPGGGNVHKGIYLPDNGSSASCFEFPPLFVT